MSFVYLKIPKMSLVSLARDAVLFAPGPAPGHGLAAELARGGDVGHQGHGPHPRHLPRLPGGRDAHVAAPAGVGAVLDTHASAVVHRLGERGQRDGGLPVDAGGAARGAEARHQVRGGGARARPHAGVVETLGARCLHPVPGPVPARPVWPCPPVAEAH